MKIIPIKLKKIYFVTMNLNKLRFRIFERRIIIKMISQVLLLLISTKVIILKNQIIDNLFKKEIISNEKLSKKIYD